MAERKDVKVSVVIPTLNEERSIGRVLEMLPRREDYEVVIVDGLSTDRTVDIAKEKGARVVMERRRGYGRAYKTGFKEARGRIIVTMDGDLTYPAEMVEELVEKLEGEGLDFITCDRFRKMEKGAMNFTHRLGNFILKAATRLLFRVPLNDSQSGMWVFRKEILKKLRLTSDGMPFSEEIKIEAFRHPEVKAEEVSVPYRPREGEVKLNTWRDGWNNLKFLFKKRFSPGGLGEPERF